MTDYLSPRLSWQLLQSLLTVAIAVVIPGVAGCRSPESASCQKPAAAVAVVSTNRPTAALRAATNQPVRTANRDTSTPRPYPVDERGFSPVDKAPAKAHAREDLVKDDAEASLN